MNNLNKKLKSLIIVLIVLAVIAVIGLIGYRRLETFIFDRYVIPNASKLLSEQTVSEMMVEEEATPAPDAPESEATPAPDATPSSSAAPKRRLTTTEIAYKVLARPDLMAELEAMVATSDKSQVIAIAKSCFTYDEKKHYVAEIGKYGITGTIKSEMMAIVQSRITSAQKAKVISLFAKYADHFRPYFE